MHITVREKIMIRKYELKYLFLLTAFFIFYPFAAHAGSVIPISQDIITQATSDGVNSTIIYIVQQYICPLVEVISGLLIVYYAISSLISGVLEAKVEKSWHPMKDKLLIAFITVTCGGLFLWLLDYIRTYKFTH